MTQIDNIPGLPLPVFSTTFAIQIEVCYSRRDILAARYSRDGRSLSDFTPVEFTILSADQGLPRNGRPFALTASVPASALHYGDSPCTDESMVDILIPNISYNTFGRRRFIAAPLPDDPKRCWHLVQRPLRDAKVVQPLIDAPHET